GHERRRISKDPHWYPDPVQVELHIPIDGVAAGRAEVPVDPSPGIRNSPGDLALTLNRRHRRLGPIGRNAEGAPRVFLALEAMAEQDLPWFARHRNRQLSA